MADLDRRYLTLVRVAELLRASEVAEFDFEAEATGRIALRLALHIRPGDDPPEVRDAAVSAFREIIETRLLAEEDGAFKVDDRVPKPGGSAQYCLVLLRRLTQTQTQTNAGTITGATAFIMRCLNDEDAATELARARRLLGLIEQEIDE